MMFDKAITNFKKIEKHKEVAEIFLLKAEK